MQVALEKRLQIFPRNEIVLERYIPCHLQPHPLPGSTVRSAIWHTRLSDAAYQRVFSCEMKISQQTSAAAFLHPASGVASQTQNKECGRLKNSSPFLLLSAALTQLPSMAHLVYRLILPISWNSSKTSISRFFYSKENPPPEESWTRDNNETWPSGPCQHFFLNLTIRLLPQSWEVQIYLKLAIQIISPSFCSM